MNPMLLTLAIRIGNYLALLLLQQGEYLFFWGWYQVQSLTYAALHVLVPTMLRLVPASSGSSIMQAVNWLMPWLRIGQAVFPFKEMAGISFAFLVAGWTVDGIKFIWRKVP